MKKMDGIARCGWATSMAAMLMFGVSGAAARAQSADKGPAQTGPAHTYRLTYTVTESDGGKHTGAQHYTMTIVALPNCGFGPGPCHAQLKQGSKEPLITGGYSHEAAPGTEYQFTYIDVGTNLDARLSETADGLQLTTKVEESGIEEPGNLQAMKDPVIRQAVLENSTMIRPGTPVVIGSVDVPGSTKHLDVEVALERVP